METVSFDGVAYVKASVAAKQFRYTADYIGQLCRSRKVDARLIGRTWFVNIDSIQKHRVDKKNKIKIVLKNKPDIPVEIKTVRKVVPPVLKNKTAVILAKSALQTGRKHLHVSYDIDEESLIPNLIKKRLPNPRSIAIEPANATKVRIESERKTQTSFIAGDLPEVSLTGKLTIQDYPEQPPVVEEETETEISQENIATTAKGDDKSKIKSRFMTLFKKSSRGAVLSELKQEKTKPISELAKPVPKEAKVKPQQHRFTPSTVLPVKNPTSNSLALKFLPLLVTFFAIGITFLVWGLSAEVLVSSTFAESKLVFSLENLSKILEYKN